MLTKNFKPISIALCFGLAACSPARTPEETKAAHDKIIQSAVELAKKNSIDRQGRIFYDYILNMAIIKNAPISTLSIYLGKHGRLQQCQKMPFAYELQKLADEFEVTPCATKHNWTEIHQVFPAMKNICNLQKGSACSKFYEITDKSLLTDIEIILDTYKRAQGLSRDQSPTHAPS